MIIKLFCTDIQLDVHDDEVATLEIQNRDCFRRIINALKGFDSLQIKEINICDEHGLIDIEDMAIIFDPYAVDVNEKTLLTKLYKDIEKRFILTEDNIFSLNQLSAYINLHLNNLISGYPLDLTIKNELTLKDYLKFLEVKISEDCQSIQDRLVQFINANSIIKFSKVIVFINLKSMLSQEEINNVFATAIRTRCPALFIENTCDCRIFENERKLTLDEDLFAVVK